MPVDSSTSKKRTKKPAAPTAKLWSILVLTQPTRELMLMNLMQILGRQLVDHPEIEVVTRMFDPSKSLGTNRDEMRRSAGGIYQNFVDDDDVIAHDYVEKILPLLDGVDYVGFRLQAYENGEPLPKPTFHSLLCGGWWENYAMYGRDLSHLNPIRKELAIQAPMYGDFGEDSRWAGDMRRLEIVKTEHFVEQVMYHYYSRTKSDGVVATAHSSSAGHCKICRSRSTVVLDGHMICNACGHRDKEPYVHD